MNTHTHTSTVSSRTQAKEQVIRPVAIQVELGCSHCRFLRLAHIPNCSVVACPDVSFSEGREVEESLAAA